MKTYRCNHCNKEHAYVAEHNKFWGDEKMNVQEFIEILKKRLDKQTTWTRHDFYDQINSAYYDYQKIIEIREFSLEVDSGVIHSEICATQIGGDCDCKGISEEWTGLGFPEHRK